MHLSFAGVATTTSGVKASLDIAIMEQAKDVYFDEIVKLINFVPIPDLHDDKGNYLRKNSFTMNERTDKVEIFTDVGQNAMVLKCAKISGVFRSEEFRYKEALLVAKGHVEVDLNTILIQFGLSFSTQTLEDGRIVPKITGVDIKVDIDRFDINIKLGGNIWADLGSMFEVFFVGTVAGMIEDDIKLTLSTGIPEVSNKILRYSDGYVPVPLVPDWIIDWETEEAAHVTNTYFSIGVKGLMFDKAYGEQEPSVEIPDMPFHSETHIDKF